MSSLRAVLAILVVALGGCSGPDDPANADYSSFPLAAGARIDKVTLYQGVERSLHNVTGNRAGGLAPPPVIAGRDAMVRVYVSPEDRKDWIARAISVVLEVGHGGEITRRNAPLVVWGSWLEDRLQSTAVFRIPGEQITADLTLSVSVHETLRVQFGPEPDLEALTWSSDAGALTVRQSGPVALHLVPVQYTADGSGREPDLTEPALGRIRDQFYAMYPVDALDIVIEPSIPYAGRIGSASGLDGLLTLIATLRAEAAPAENAYFYGLVDPAATFGAFCGGGCTTGLSLLPPSPADSWARASVGVGFEEVAADVLVHEVGHAHGRQHAPCGGAPGADAGYPYPNGTILVWGYDMVHNQLKDPAIHVDMMSYCEPIWISDYTFTALRGWVADVAALQGLRGAPREWQLVAVGAHGEAELGARVEAPAVPGGDRVLVELLDASGAGVGESQGWFVPFDHAHGGLALIPPLGRGVAGVRVHTEGTSR